MAADVHTALSKVERVSLTGFSDYA